jgi:hypothetical protein
MSRLDVDLGQGVTVGMVLVGVLMAFALGLGLWFKSKRKGWRFWQPPEE